MIYLYLILLIIAPQLWFKPVLGLRVDYILYPLWFVSLTLRGRLKELFSLSKIDSFFLAMIVWFLISIIINDKHANSLNIGILYFKYFLLFKLISASIADFNAFKRVILFLLFLIFTLVFESIDHKTAVDGLGWVGQPLGWADEEVIQQSGSGRTQWINIFDGPGVFCVLFTIALPFVVHFFDRHYSIITKIGATIGLWFLGIAIYFTGSRGGFLASVVCMFAYVLSRSRLSVKQLILASSASLLIFMMAPAFLTSTSDSHGSAQHRVDMWKEGVEMTQFYPVFGVGKGNFLNYTGRLIAHNSAIEVMGETGLPGFFLWLSLITLAFKNIYSFHQNSDDLDEKSYATALAISITGYIASSMFVTLEYETFYFLLALAAVLGKFSGQEITFKKIDFYCLSGLMISWIVILKGFFRIYN